MGAQLVASDAGANRLAWTAKVTVLPGAPHTAETSGAVELRLGDKAARGALGICLRDRCADQESTDAKGNVCFRHGAAVPQGAYMKVAS